MAAVTTEIAAIRQSLAALTRRLGQLELEAGGRTARPPSRHSIRRRDAVGSGATAAWEPGAAAWPDSMPDPFPERIEVEAQRAGRRPKTFCVLDFETDATGSTQDLRIIQVGAVCLNERLEELGEWGSFCNPGTDISADAKKIHSIGNEMVRGLAGWGVVGAHFQNFVEQFRPPNGEIIFVAHNGKRFDLRILVFENARNNIENQPNTYHVDSIDVCKKLYTGLPSYSLKAVYNHVFGTDVPDAHDALSDAKAVVNLFKQHTPDTIGHVAEDLKESLNAVVKRCMR